MLCLLGRPTGWSGRAAEVTGQWLCGPLVGAVRRAYAVSVPPLPAGIGRSRWIDARPLARCVRTARVVRGVEGGRASMLGVVGIDSHKRSLAVCLADEVGRRLAGSEFANTPSGHAALLVWVRERAGAGEVRFAIEGARGYGAALCDALLVAGELVVEVPASQTRRERRQLRGAGRSDQRDALAIARVALREPSLPPLRLDGATRDLKLAYDYRRQLTVERTRVANRLHFDLMAFQPGYERDVPHLRTPRTLEAASRLLRGRRGVRANLARRRLARLRALDREIAELGEDLKRLVERTGSGLTALRGISHVNAARILGEVGDVRRFPTRGHFARANGTAPVPDASGSLGRMRLNWYGNRRLNYAIHVMALTQ